MNMKCKIRKLVCLAWMLTMTVVAYAQGNVSGWTVNPYEYQYDMTVYAKLVIDEKDVTDYSNYEVAAFVGNECRGVAEVNKTEEGNYVWLYIRVRTDNTKDVFSFKYYDKQERKEKRINEAFSFEVNGYGQPSSPMALTPTQYTLGDVNDDGRINVADIVAIRRLNAGLDDGKFIKEAADVNGDGRTNVADIVAIRRMQ